MPLMLFLHIIYKDWTEWLVRRYLFVISAVGYCTMCAGDAAFLYSQSQVTGYEVWKTWVGFGFGMNGDEVFVG